MIKVSRGFITSRARLSFSFHPEFHNSAVVVIIPVCGALFFSANPDGINNAQAPENNIDPVIKNRKTRL